MGDGGMLIVHQEVIQVSIWVSFQDLFHNTKKKKN